MGEAIPGVNVQALTAFFSKNFEQSKTSTQPRQKVHRKKALLKLLEFGSKPDLTTCKTSDLSSFSRSLSSFDVTNSGTLPHITSKYGNSWKRKQQVNHTSINCVPTKSSSVLNDNIRSRTKLCQNNCCALDATSNDSGVDCKSKDVQLLQYDSGLEENAESSASEHSTTAGKSICLASKFSPKNGSKQVQNNLPDKDSSRTSGESLPAFNVVVKEPVLENKYVQPMVTNGNRRNIVTTVWNRTYEVDINTEIEKNLVNKLPPDRLFYSEIVVSDNYVCKTQYKRTELPSTEALGPPPCKPKKLDNVKFPFLFPSTKSQSFQKQVILPKSRERPADGSCHSLTQNISGNPSNPLCAHEHSNNKNFQRTLSDTSMNNSCSKQQQRYFHESSDLANKSRHEVAALQPPVLPPRRLSCPSYLSEKSTVIPDVPGEELYQDATVEDENLYEEVPFPNDYQSHIYTNHAKSDKLAKEITRLWQKENRERLRQERELEKLKRKFGITGEEVPLEKGCIKRDAKGGHGDLAVKKGESVLIVRVVDNPIGRLLVQNDRGKFGYVALDNLTVDADSIKIVMKERKNFMENKERSYSSSSSSAYATYEEC